MARKHRLHYPGAYYHVILRGNAQQDIFFSDKDRYRFYLLLQEGIERYGCSIHAFCLMTNHVHLLYQVDTIPLSRIIQNLSFRYARWVNWRRSRVGHLFQGRYKATVIDADRYLLQLVSYIHLNPVRAKITKDVALYQWSSHKTYLGQEEIPWLSTKPILSYFGTRLKAARIAFDRMVREKAEEGHHEEFYTGCKYDSRLLGGDDFYVDVQAKTDELPRTTPDLQTIIETVEQICNLEAGELNAGGRDFRSGEARSLAAWAVLEMSNETLTDLGKKVGRDVSTLSSAVNRLLRRVKLDASLAEKLAGLKRALSEIETLQA